MIIKRFVPMLVFSHITGCVFLLVALQSHLGVCFTSCLHKENANHKFMHDQEILSYANTRVTALQTTKDTSIIIYTYSDTRKLKHPF